MNAQKMLAELERDEDVRLKPYRCPAGKLTIGIGRNIEDRGITLDEALYLARNDIDLVVAELEQRLPWFHELDEVRQRVLVNMGFNLGVPKLLEFKATLAALATGNYVAAANEMRRSKWATQVGARAERLARMMVQGGDA